MEKKDKDFAKLYKEFKIPAMKQLSEKDRKAISIDHYKADREAGTYALTTFAQKTIILACTAKPLSEKKLIKKTHEYAHYLIRLRDISTGLSAATAIHDEITAKVVALSKMPAEEAHYFTSALYHADREKASKAIEHFAQLACEEMINNNLLEISPEEYKSDFIAQKEKELAKLYTN